MRKKPSGIEGRIRRGALHVLAKAKAGAAKSKAKAGAAKSNPLRSHHNIEWLGGREEVVDAPTDGFIRWLVEQHALHLAVRLEHRLF